MSTVKQIPQSVFCSAALTKGCQLAMDRLCAGLVPVVVLTKNSVIKLKSTSVYYCMFVFRPALLLVQLA